MWWEGDEAWYSGTVRSFDVVFSEHTVSYDDGEQMQEELDKCSWRLEVTQAPTGAGRKSRKRRALMAQRLPRQRADVRGDGKGSDGGQRSVAASGGVQGMDGEEQLSGPAGSPFTQPSTPLPPLPAKAVASAARQASTHPPSSAHQTAPLPKLDPHAFVSVAASGHQAVEALLARCRLSEYAPQFAAMGYDVRYPSPPSAKVILYPWLRPTRPKP